MADEGGTSDNAFSSAWLSPKVTQRAPPRANVYSREQMFAFRTKRIPVPADLPTGVPSVISSEVLEPYNAKGPEAMEEVRCVIESPRVAVE